MRRASVHAFGRSRAGGILLELLIAIAMFAAAATLTLGAMRDALDGVRRAELRARAMDLAATRLAEVDAGLIPIGDLGDRSAEDLIGEEGGDRLRVELSVVRDGDNRSGTVRVRAVVRDASILDEPILAERERSVDALPDRTREGGR